MEKDAREGVFGRGRLEEEDVAIVEDTASEARARRSIDGETEVANGYGAIVGDADGSAEAPDKAPPGASGNGADLAVTLGERLLVGGVRSGAKLAMDFMMIGVSDEVVDERVGTIDGVDGLGGEERWETLLPIVVATLDFAFCLRSGSVAKGDAVEAQSLAELSESVRKVGVKERVIIDVKSEREAVSEESAGEKIEVRREVFRWVNASAGIEPGRIVENIEQGEFIRIAREPSVRRRIVLPKRAEVADLPPADGFGRRFKTEIWSELMRDSPTANGRAVGLESKTAQQFAGHGAIRGRRRRRKKARRQSHRLSRPTKPMIPARSARRPRLRPPRRTSAEILRAELINTRKTHAEFGSERRRIQKLCAKLSEKMTNERSRKPAQQLWFFIPPPVAGRWILRIPAETGQG